jgi:hypothetical protein
MSDMEKFKSDYANEMKALDPIASTPVAPAHGIAAIALNMAIKYHDMGMIKDGALYQQYKIEGKNIQTIGLDHVFETAMRMEAFLLGASERIAKVVVDALEAAVEEDDPEATASDTTA